MKDYDEHGWGKDKPPVTKKTNWWRVAFFIAIGLSIFENFLK
jgi:hypothetical protein